MDDQVRRSPAHGQVIDITTTGRRTGQPRRIEIVDHVIDGRIFISGMPRPDATPGLDPQPDGGSAPDRPPQDAGPRRRARRPPGSSRDEAERRRRLRVDHDPRLEDQDVDGHGRPEPAHRGQPAIGAGVDPLDWRSVRDPSERPEPDPPRATRARATRRAEPVRPPGRPPRRAHQRAHRGVPRRPRPGAPRPRPRHLRSEAPAPAAPRRCPLDTRTDWDAALRHEDARVARYGRPAAVIVVDLQSGRGRARGSLRGARRRRSCVTTPARRTASPGSVRPASTSCCPRRSEPEADVLAERVRATCAGWGTVGPGLPLTIDRRGGHAARWRDPGRGAPRRPGAADRPRLADQRVDQALELGGRIVGQAGVHRRGLDDRAGRGHQPVEPLRLPERGDGAARRVARGDGLDGLEVGHGPRPGRGPGRRPPAGPSSRAMRAPMNRRGRHSRTTPTFRHSPRSTRGMTRTIAYW